MRITMTDPSTKERKCVNKITKKINFILKRQKNGKRNIDEPF